MYLLAIAALAAAAALPAFSQPRRAPSAGPDTIQARYTKYEYRIPMRDGKRLFTAVYVPKDTARTYPILMTRTPYSISPYGVDRYPERLGPAPVFERSGYIFVSQDVRGRNLSEGVFVDETPHRPVKNGPQDIDESTDTWDTVEWLVKRIPHNNGNVGLYGVSYGGFYSAAGIIDAHPALKAASPQAPMGDEYLGDDAYHNGAFFLAANFGFYSMFKPQATPAPPDRYGPRFDYRTPDGYDFFLNRMGTLAEAGAKLFGGRNAYFDDVVRHTAYDDYWKSRAIWRFLKNIKPAILTVGGWFDTEDLAGPFHVFHAIERNNPPAANLLVMGPWSHGGWSHGDGDRLGDVQFHSKTSEYYHEEIEFPFFERFLKGQSGKELAKANVFETGTNVWRRYPAWPPATAKTRTIYFRAGGTLSFDPPAEGDGYDEYLSDPNKPVPFLGRVTQGVPHDYMTADQRFASTRPDVLTWATPPLEEDIVVAGPVRPVLHVSTTGTDSDFVVKLIDVYPDDYPEAGAESAAVRMGGYQQLVRGEPIRAKFRNSMETPEPMPPGKMVRIAYPMPDICHAFRRGHRIMVQVQSSWFPLVDRNPQKFMDIPAARPADFQKVTQRVMRSAKAPSGIELPVLE
jgi:uncharacterized protein